jgi:hypothetical protein
VSVAVLLLCCCTGTVTQTTEASFWCTVSLCSLVDQYKNWTSKQAVSTLFLAWTQVGVKQNILWSFISELSFEAWICVEFKWRWLNHHPLLLSSESLLCFCYCLLENYWTIAYYCDFKWNQWMLGFFQQVSCPVEWRNRHFSTTYSLLSICSLSQLL